MFPVASTVHSIAHNKHLLNIYGMEVYVIGIGIQRDMWLFMTFLKPMGSIYFNPLICTKKKLRPRKKESSQCDMSFAGDIIKYKIFVRPGPIWLSG